MSYCFNNCGEGFSVISGDTLIFRRYPPLSTACMGEMNFIMSADSVV